MIDEEREGKTIVCEDGKERKRMEKTGRGKKGKGKRKKKGKK